MNTAPDRPEQRWPFGHYAAAVGAGVLLCFLYVSIEFRDNALTEGHRYSLGDLSYAFLFHLPLFLLLALSGALVSTVRGERNAPGYSFSCAWCATLTSGILLAQTGRRLLENNAVPGILALAAGVAVFLLVAAALTVAYRWLVGANRKRDLLGWGYGTGILLMVTLFMLWNQQDERGFFEPRSLIPKALACIAGIVILTGLSWLCRRAFLFWALAMLSLAALMPTYIPWRTDRPALRTPPREDAPNVVLICIDALRADYLSLYGFDRRTSPGLRKIARTGTTFSNCIACSNWTKPSTTSLFASVEPSVHGVNRVMSFVPDELDVAAEVFRDAGYRTIGIVANHQLSAFFGFGQGFDVFVDPTMDMSYLTMLGRSCSRWFLTPLSRWIPKSTSGLTGIDAEDVCQRALREIEAAPQPFFLYLHLMDPHAPYDPPGEFDVVFNPERYRRYSFLTLRTNPSSVPEEGVRELADRYCGEILYADATVAEFLESLSTNERTNRTLFAITADHGEAFGDHGDFLHGHSLYEELIHIPLLLVGPGVPVGETWEEVVSQMDIAPTIVQLAGIDPPRSWRGRSLAAGLVVSGATREREFVLSESSGAYAALRGQDWKYFEARPEKVANSLPHHYAHKDTTEYFNLKTDPGETNNLAGDPAIPSRRKSLNTILQVIQSKAVEQETVELDDEIRRKLQALGYF